MPTRPESDLPIRHRAWPSRASLVVGAIAAALAVAPACARAQSVEGRVVDQATMRPIGGARLALISDSGTVVAKDVADSSRGEFYLDAPTRGHYRVEIVVGRGGLVASPSFALDSDQVIQREYVVPPLPQALRDAYLPQDVTRPAQFAPRQWPPRYPDGLRSQGQRGIVRAIVVVDSIGRPDMTTFQVFESTSPEFTESVRDALLRFHFVPAELDGRPVAQVKRISVDFGFCAEPSRLRPDDGDGIVIRASGGHCPLQQP